MTATTPCQHQWSRVVQIRGQDGAWYEMPTALVQCGGCNAEAEDDIPFDPLVHTSEWATAMFNARSDRQMGRLRSSVRRLNSTLLGVGEQAQNAADAMAGLGMTAPAHATTRLVARLRRAQAPTRSALLFWNAHPVHRGIDWAATVRGQLWQHHRNTGLVHAPMTEPGEMPPF